MLEGIKRNMAGTKNLVIYELNEVPERVLRYYIDIRPMSTFAQLMREGLFVRTITKDIGELHPWSTWPTVHRGVNNSLHQIQYLNQDLSSANAAYPAIWDVLISNGIDVGLFGSLQSYPPVKGELVRFHVPDTFAPNFDSYPPRLSMFQRFNLSMAGKNKAVSGRFSAKDVILFCRLLIGRTLSLGVIFPAIRQVFLELKNPIWKARRSLMQPLFCFDVYRKLLIREKPSFSTFFTNHVAGMMHRYWRDLFPKDFQVTQPNKSFHSNSILAAMDIADSQLSDLLHYCRRSGSDLWVISSMGQAAIDRGDYVPETFLDDWQRLLFCLDLPIEDFEYVPAMQPEICFHCRNSNSLDNLRASLSSVTDSDGSLVFVERYGSTGNTISFSLGKSRILASEQCVHVNGALYKISDLGIKIITRDQGTGYHIPEGILLAWGMNSSQLFSDSIVDTTEIFSKIMSFYGL